MCLLETTNACDQRKLLYSVSVLQDPTDIPISLDNGGTIFINLSYKNVFKIVTRYGRLQNFHLYLVKLGAKLYEI